LICEEEHIRYYFREVIKMDELEEVQVRLFKELSPVWKAMILDRIYEEIEWENTPREIVKIENKFTVYNEGTKDEHYFAENLKEENKERIRMNRNKEIPKGTKNFSLQGKC
jgi:hypothetical protein